MSLGESLLLGVLGMTIVFIVLIIINFMIKILSSVVNATQKKPTDG